MNQHRSGVCVGQRYGKVVVLDVLTATEKGEPGSGAWARIRCSCGVRRTVRARHLGIHAWGGIVSCGNRFTHPLGIGIPGPRAKPKQQGLGFSTGEAPQAPSNSVGRRSDPEEAA